MNEINNSTEERLRAKVEDLRHQLEEQKRVRHAGAKHNSRPSGRLWILLGFLLLALIAARFLAGYRPRQRREEALAAEAKNAAKSLPLVKIIRVARAENRRHL